MDYDLRYRDMNLWDQFWWGLVVAWMIAAPIATVVCVVLAFIVHPGFWWGAIALSLAWSTSPGWLFDSVPTSSNRDRWERIRYRKVYGMDAYLDHYAEKDER